MIGTLLHQITLYSLFLKLSIDLGADRQMLGLMAAALRSLAVWQRSPPAATVEGVRLKGGEGGIPGTLDTGYWILDGGSWAKASEKTRMADNYYYDDDSDLYCYHLYCSAVRSGTTLITSRQFFLSLRIRLV